MNVGGVIAANEVPVWAALLTGLGAGVIGTLIAQGHERGKEMRTRMLQAADDYLSAGIKTERASEDLWNALIADVVPPSDKLEELARRLEESRDEMSAMIPRLILLFGAYSQTRVAAVSLNYAWGVVAGSLEKRLEGGWLDDETFSRDWDMAAGAIAAFGKAARQDVRFGAVSRWGLRLRNLR